MSRFGHVSKILETVSVSVSQTHFFCIGNSLANLFVSSRVECVTKMQHNIKFVEITLHIRSTVVFSHRLVVCALAGCDSIFSDGGVVPGSRGDGFGQRRPHQTDNDAAVLGAVNEGKYIATCANSFLKYEGHILSLKIKMIRICFVYVHTSGSDLVAQLRGGPVHGGVHLSRLHAANTGTTCCASVLMSDMVTKVTI